MPLFHIVILALIQGLTEFLPVSSSGHLILGHAALNHDVEQALWGELLTMDIAVHVGTLLAVLVYFRRDICHMACGLRHFRPNGDKEGRHLVICLLIGSLPVIFAGFLFHFFEPSWLRSVEITAWCTLIFGIVLWLGDRTEQTDRTLEKLTVKDALWIGFAQILALIPGTSRSGITMTAARFLGFSRKEAAHFSMLLAIVAISGAGALGAIDVWQSGNFTLGLSTLLAIVLSFISGLGAIALMMRWLEKSTFMPFVIYRIGLGLLLLGLLYGGAL